MSIKDKKEMKRSAIEFNKLMSQNEIIASVRQFMDEDERLKERKGLE